MRRAVIAVALFISGGGASGCWTPDATARTTAFAAQEASWIAGDHHIHSRFSVGWDRTQDPPAPIVGGDAIYPIPMNAIMARRFGLSWMVSTDHGGPNHSRVNMDMAYPELLMSREAVPEVIQFMGMELDPPAGDHASLIMPHTHDEAENLFEIESRFSRQEPWPRDSTYAETWNTEAHMLDALRVMDSLATKPLVIANHPSRSADSIGQYGLYSPAEFRGWNDQAPEVAVGMAGAPGHQAIGIAADGTISSRGARGGYSRAATMGGFDQMTAIVGGFWDSMLGEGRRWWITANSDSHIHWREGGADFWPGEYSKTYVHAAKNHDDIMTGIRNGRVFVTLGDLVSEVWFEATSNGETAMTGGELHVHEGNDVTVSLRIRDPEGMNHRGERPTVARVDIITGQVTGPVEDLTTDHNPTTRVAARFDASQWVRDGEYLTISFVMNDVTEDMYIRVRGTNGVELEPEADLVGEDPWSDLWFYTNPIFIEVGDAHQ